MCDTTLFLSDVVNNSDYKDSCSLGHDTMKSGKVY